MTERVFNLFLFVDHAAEGIARGIGAVAHDRSGTDDEKLAFLQGRIADDLPAAKRYPMPGRYIVGREVGPVHFTKGELAFETFQELQALGLHAQVFADLGGPRDPLMCVTPVVAGIFRVDDVVRW